eukprot:9031468-Alexandrium_andersonii.AAC.1
MRNALLGDGGLLAQQQDIAPPDLDADADIGSMLQPAGTLALKGDKTKGEKTKGGKNKGGKNKGG